MPKKAAKSSPKSNTNMLSVTGMQKWSDRRKSAFIALVVGIIGVSSAFGFASYRDQQTAHAGGYVQLSGNATSHVYVCLTGGSVKFMITNGATSSGQSYGLQVRSTSGAIYSSQNLWLNPYSGSTRYLAYSSGSQIAYSGGAGAGGTRSVGSIPSC